MIGCITFIILTIYSISSYQLTKYPIALWVGKTSAKIIALGGSHSNLIIFGRSTEFLNIIKFRILWDVRSKKEVIRKSACKTLCGANHTNAAGTSCAF